MNSETHCPFCKKPFTAEEIVENDRAEGQFLQEIEHEEVAPCWPGVQITEWMPRQKCQGAE